MQPTRLKSSFSEDVKLLSGILPLLSLFFLLKLCLKLQVLEGSHGGETACPLNAEHLQSGGEMYILYSQLWFALPSGHRTGGTTRCEAALAHSPPVEPEHQIISVYTAKQILSYIILESNLLKVPLELHLFPKYS